MQSKTIVLVMRIITLRGLGSFCVPFRYDGTERNGFEERSVGDGTEIRIVPSDFRRAHVTVVFFTYRQDMIKTHPYLEVVNSSSDEPGVV